MTTFAGPSRGRAFTTSSRSPLVPVRESSHHATVTLRVALLLGLIAATLAAGCKQEAQRTGAPAKPPPPPAQPPTPPVPIGDPFAHAPPWAPDPLAFPPPSSVRVRTVPPPPSPAPSANPLIALERTLALSKDPSQAQRGRAMLEGRVLRHMATREEVGMLTSVCQAEPDKFCVQVLDQESSR